MVGGEGRPLRSVGPRFLNLQESAVLQNAIPCALVGGHLDRESIVQDEDFPC